MKRRAKLLVVGQDVHVTLRSYTGRPEYKTVRKLVIRRKDIELDIQAVKEKVKVLQEKYPKKGFYFEWTKVTNLSAPDPCPLSFQMERNMTREMTCWVFGRRAKGEKNIPLYWCPRFKRLYVPSSYWGHQKRLTSSMISYRLRDFGIPYDLAYA